MSTGNSILDRIKQEVLDEGLDEATPAFGKRFRQLHVIECREMRGYTSCQECSYNDSCSLYITVKREYILGE